MEDPTPPVMPQRSFARLIEAAASVAGQTGLHAVLRRTVETAMQLTGARYGALGIIGQHGVLADFIHLGIDRHAADMIGRLPEGKGVLGTITRVGKPIRIDDITTHPDSAGFPDHHPPMTTFLGVPVRVGENVFGNLYLTEKPEPFSDEDESVVEALATIAGSAISTARLHDRLRRVALAEDRERIARELHDSVIQDLFAVGLSLQAVAVRANDDPHLVQERIAEAIDQLDSSISTLRRYIFDIRTRITTAPDLEAELLTLAAQLSEPHDAEVRLNISEDLSGLPGDLVAETIQFVREAVNNALQHSGAEVVDVTIARGQREILVEVRDAGRGFDPVHVARGMGLDNLIDRAGRAGGRAEILSRPDEGTTVRAVLPIRRTAADV